MLVGIADTHTAIWYLYRDPRLSETARLFIDESGAKGDRIGVSTITLAEVIYLREKRRLPQEVLDDLMTYLDLSHTVLEEVPVDRKVAASIPNVNRLIVSDMPDRIILATAWAYAVPIISRDGQVQRAGYPFIW